ncbi:MAG: carboxypeptidase-like regulatory domain-containing protein [Planctomycetota bacterium]
MSPYAYGADHGERGAPARRATADGRAAAPTQLATAGAERARRPAAEASGAAPASEATEGEPAGALAFAYLPGTAGAPPPAEWPLLVRATGAQAVGADVAVRVELDSFGSYWMEPLRGTLDEHGEARLDVGPLLASLVAHGGGERASELIVEVSHPDLVPAVASRLLPDELEPEVPPAEPLVVDVALRAAAVVVGRLVRAEDGAPVRGERFVQSYALVGEELDQRSDGDAEVADDGAFRLRVNGEGPHALALYGAGRRPATVRRSLARGRVEELGDVALDAGFAIRGTALAIDGGRRPDTSVFAQLVGAGSSLPAPGHVESLPFGLTWYRGAFELFGAQATTGRDGGFRLVGLAPEAYQPSAHEPDYRAPLPLPPAPAVRAPGEVELRPQAVLITLRLRFPDGAPREGRERWRAGERQADSKLPAWSFIQDPVLRRALPPATSVELTLRFRGLQPAVLLFETPAAGGSLEREVELALDHDAARLVLLLQGAPVPEGERFVLFQPGEPDLEWTRTAADGRLVLDDLPPGELDLTVTAGGDRFAPRGFLCPARVQLSLAPGEERVVPLTLRRGGTLVLEALAPGGERVSARCEVFGPGGEPVPMMFMARIPNGRAAGWGYLFHEAPSRGTAPLAPGRYRLRVEAGDEYEVEELFVDLAEGRTTEAAVRLRSRR